LHQKTVRLLWILFDPRLLEHIARYDGEIAYVDDNIKALVEGLRAMGTLDKTILVFTSDHGEEFLEHIFVDHAWSLYEEVLHIPLLIRTPPGILKPQRLDHRVALTDVAPTILKMTQTAHTSLMQPFGGRYLVDWDGKQWQPVRPEGTIVAELFTETRSNMRALIHDDFKYIAATRALDGEQCQLVWSVQAELTQLLKTGVLKTLDPWADIQQEFLFNMKLDPSEHNNLLETEPEELSAMRQRLEAYRVWCRDNVPHPDHFTGEDPYTKAFLIDLKEQAATGDAPPTATPEATDPDDTPSLSEETIDNLQGLGYL
jgi:arylsulfatase A-like enzyme